jgi:hypothetical protein
MINNPVHPISQYGHFSNILNSCRRRRNRWHLLHHALPLEELASSDLKHKIDYTQYHTQPRSKLKHACIWKDAYRKVGALVEHMVKVLLCGCSVPVGKNMAIQAIHPPCACDGHCSVVWALRHGCCLRGDIGRETEWMAAFVWRPGKKSGGKKWHQNNPGSNGREETSPSPLPLTIKVIYIILKNKPWRNWPHKPEYSRFASGSIVIWNQPPRSWYPDWWGLLSPWCYTKQMFVWNFLTWLLPSSVSEVGLIGRRVVIPCFNAKTMYSSYICPGSIVWHIRIKSAHK